MKKICLISDHHLCINPRLWKEAFLYERLGFEVVIITKWQSSDLKQRDLELLAFHKITYKCYLDITPGVTNSGRRFYYRLRRRIGSELQRHLNAGGAWAINHAPNELFKAALRENADHYSAHLESGLYAGVKLIKAGKKVSFDFEDWYSQDYLLPDRAINLLKKLEQVALQRGVYCTAPSSAMVKAFYSVYNINKTIVPIYNSFPEIELKELPPVLINSKCRIVWTSRTVGPGRGLETLLKTMNILDKPVEIHIIGQCPIYYRDYLLNHFPYSKGHELKLHDFVNHDGLLSLLAQFDAGLAIEQNSPENKNTTISNKILQYLQAGLQILATDTLGQMEVAAYFPQTIQLVKQNDIESWKQAIENMIDNRYKYDRKMQLSIYDKFFSWKNQEEKLIKLIEENI